MTVPAGGRPRLAQPPGEQPAGVPDRYAPHAVDGCHEAHRLGDLARDMTAHDACSSVVIPHPRPGRT